MTQVPTQGVSILFEPFFSGPKLVSHWKSQEAQFQLKIKIIQFLYLHKDQKVLITSTQNCKGNDSAYFMIQCMHKALRKQVKKNAATSHSFKRECPIRRGYISVLFFFFFTNQPSTDWLRSFVKQKGCKKKLCDQRMGVPLVYSPHLSFFDPPG